MTNDIFDNDRNETRGLISVRRYNDLPIPPGGLRKCEICGIPEQMPRSNTRYVTNWKIAIIVNFFFYIRRDFKLRLEGHWTDKLLNMVSSAVTKVFRTQVLREIETIAYEELDKKVQEINNLIERPVITEAPPKRQEERSDSQINGFSM